MRISAEFAAGCELRIEDDGPGVAAEQLAALGQRGMRLDEQVTGTGLGLAITRDIVDAYQGELQLGKSAMGGLQVALSLPCAGQPD